MGWEPPSEESFNDEWLTPKEALKLGAGSKMRIWLLDRLRGGIIIAVARTAFDETDAPPKTYQPVPRSTWRDSITAYGALWEMGTAYAFHPGNDGSKRDTYLDVRFDPATISSMPPEVAPKHDPNSIEELFRKYETVKAAGGPDAINNMAAALQAGAATGPEAVKLTTPLPPTEYANLARAIAAGWGMKINEDRAWEMAKLLFPHHIVRRAPFLAEYRRERGGKRPGKQPSR